MAVLYTVWKMGAAGTFSQHTAITALKISHLERLLKSPYILNMQGPQKNLRIQQYWPLS